MIQILKKKFKSAGFTPTPNHNESVVADEQNNHSKNLKRNHRRKSMVWGFTLIELLVVIAIIGVLSSIVLASLQNARRKSRDARRITDIKQLQLALELYYDANNQNYPTTNAVCNTTTPSFFGLEALQTGGFIPQIPRDPSQSGTTSGCYAYATFASGTRSSYHLGATLEDTTNQALQNDADVAVTTGFSNDFSGLSAAVAPAACNATAGTAQPSGTETCYDVKP